jgi:hypothetical protein
MCGQLRLEPEDVATERSKVGASAVVSDVSARPSADGRVRELVRRRDQAHTG